MAWTNAFRVVSGSAAAASPSQPLQIGADAHRRTRRSWEQAVRMVLETKADYATEFTAMVSVARKVGIGPPETLRKWVRRAEVGAGQRPGITTEESEQIKALKRAPLQQQA